MTAALPVPARGRPRGPRVLLVEDDAPVRELIARALRANGFEVHPAASAEEALELEATRPVDLLVSDVTLANLSGLDVARAIRRRSPHVAAVLMSGHDDQAVAGAAHLDIAATVLHKPFAMAELFVHLRAACAARGCTGGLGALASRT